MKLKYYFMPDRWRAYSIYLLQKLLRRLGEADYVPEVHEVEQYMYRYLTCPECMAESKCVKSDCGCKMPERAHVRTDFCPTYKWGPFKDKESWKEFKYNNEIQFLIKSKIHQNG